jgi:rhodanese-related sulfurtransferase
MMSKETTDTLGNQKKFNYALRADMRREDFVKAVTDGLVAPPQYFPKNAVLNRMGYESIDEVMTRGLTFLEVDEFANMASEKGTLVLDTRNAKEFAKGFVPGSYFMGIDGSFASWVGTLIEDLQTPFLIIADEGREEEVVTRLARVGYDHVVGFLKGGFEAWKAAGQRFNTLLEVTAADLANHLKAGEKLNVLDVRKVSEYSSQHITGFANFPLDFINQNLSQLDPSETYYIHCAGGYRSVIAASMMLANGFATPVNILEGYRALVQTDLSTTDYVQPTTML